MMEAEFSIRGMRFWIVDLAADRSCSVTVTECIPWRKKGGQALFEIYGMEGDVEEAIDEVRARPEIISVEVVESSEGRVVGSVAMRDLWVIWNIVDCGCFLESAWSNGDGKASFKVLSGSEGSLPNLIKAISSRGVDIEITRIARTVDRPVVTRKQEKVLRLALERGYFDYPKRITLEELAIMSGMSTSTVAETIKRGERNILKNFFEKRK
ncbi:MAG: helix-turn-helix domain-containing protein [Methanomassiliicoccus sp.]|nr:helix-turn-helix domain-containing protein [Methanomassiliicoccus sp.]